MRKLIPAAIAATLLLGPAHADQILGPGRIDSSSRVILPGGPTLGLWQSGKFTSTPDTLQIKGTGSTGDVSGMSVTPSGSAAAGTLARTVADQASAISAKAGLASPVFTGTPSMPALNLTGTGSTGDISTMSAKSNVSGTVVRSLNDKFAERISIKDWGAKGDGTTDDSAAFSGMLSALASGGGQGYFPCGVYKIASGQTITVAAGKKLSLTGANTSCVEVWFAGQTGNGLKATFANKYGALDVSDLTWTTDTDTTTSIGIALFGPVGDLDPASQPKKTFSRVIFRGHDGFLAGAHWGVDVAATLVSSIDFNQSQFFGGTPSSQAHIGTYIAGQNGTACGGTACYAVHYSFNQCYFAGSNYGIQIGDVAQGFTVDGSNFNVGNYGIYAASGQYANDGLSVYGGSQFNVNTAGIGIFSQMYSINIQGNFFIILNANEAGVRLAAPGFNVSNNRFQGFGTNLTGIVGVHLVTGATNGLVSGNNFTNFPVAVALISGTSGNQVVSNLYSGNTANVSDTGSGNTVLDTFGGTVGQWKLKGSAPTTADILPSYFSMYKNSGDGSMKLCANDGGTIKCATLQ
jgi:hypothetical protein